MPPTESIEIADGWGVWGSLYIGMVMVETGDGRDCSKPLPETAQLATKAHPVYLFGIPDSHRIENHQTTFRNIATRSPQRLDDILDGAVNLEVI